MIPLPRLAVGTIQPQADSHAILWGLMEALRARGLQVQSFRSRACFAAETETAAVTGLHPRHLDSWLMSPDLCRRLLLRATDHCDIAVVEGEAAEGRVAVDIQLR